MASFDFRPASNLLPGENSFPTTESDPFVASVVEPVSSESDFPAIISFEALPPLQSPIAPSLPIAIREPGTGLFLILALSAG
jgi:hypothetical protein